MADYYLQYQDTHIDALLATANELKTAGYIYKGVATPSTNPGTPTERVAYLASEPGTYTNFGGIVITSGLYSLTYASGTWTGTQMQAGSDIEVVQTTGDSTTDVMSQKAVTDELNTLSENLQDVENYRSIEDVIDFNALEEKSGLMGSATQWLIPVSKTPRRHVSIAVTPGEVFRIDALESHPTVYACLTYDQIPTTNLQAIALCEGCIREIVAAGESATITIPSDCTYLAIGKTNKVVGDHAPKSIYKLTSASTPINQALQDVEFLQNEQSKPKFFATNANWDVVNTEEVRGTLLTMELLRGNIPSGSYLQYFGGATNFPNIFSLRICDSNGTIIAAYWNAIPSDGNAIEIETSPNYPCVFRCLINGQNMKINTGGMYDWGSDLVLNEYYFNATTPKTILCFGDSLTQFKDANNLRYSDYLASLTGCKVENAGIGGTQLCQRVTPVLSPSSLLEGWAGLDMASLIKAWVDNDWDTVDACVTYQYNYSHSRDYRAIVANLKTINIADVDIVTIFGGTNDFTSEVTELGDAGSTNIQNVAGAVEEITRILQTAKPSIEIYFFTPIVRYVVNTRTEANWSDNYITQGRKLPDVVNTIASSCQYWHVPCRNWYWDLGWTRFNFSNFFNDNDGTHPYKGFKYLGIKMFEFLKTQTQFVK